MNDEKRIELFKASVDRFIPKWVKRLGLSHWRIEYNITRFGDDKDGLCEVHRAQGNRATITFSENVLQESDERQEETVIHELLHIPLDEMMRFAQHYLEDTEYEYLKRLLEIAVSNLSKALLVEE